MTQGIIDQTLYSRETTALLAASEDIQKEIDRLENPLPDVAGVLLEARAPFSTSPRKSEMLQAFDDKLFNEFVEHITVHSLS